MEYFDEYITAECATATYGRMFGELMNAADKGLIHRSERIGRNGNMLYTFRRGDVAQMKEIENGSGNK